MNEYPTKPVLCKEYPTKPSCVGSNQLNLYLVGSTKINLYWVGSTKLNLHFVGGLNLYCVTIWSNQLNLYYVGSTQLNLYCLGSNQLNLEQNMDEDATVYLNVGGKRFEILWNTLGQYPTSRNKINTYIFLSFFNYKTFFSCKSAVNRTGLKTLECWISRSMLNLFFLLISRLI